MACLVVHSQAPNPNSQFPNKFQIRKSNENNYSLFEMIAEKINVNSRASSANLSRADAVLCDEPASIKRKNNRLSFASLRQNLQAHEKVFLAQCLIGFDPICRDRT